MPSPYQVITVGLAATDAPLPPDAPSVNVSRINDDRGKFSFVAPPGWTVSNGQRLTYGTTLLTNPAVPDGVIVLGPLDGKLFAASYPDNRRAAIRLASDMGNFLTPYPGDRINSDDQPFDADGLPAAQAYYETKFDDPHRENGQMWAAAVGYDPNRFFVLWRGIASSPVDRTQAQALAQSIQPY